MVEIDYEFRSSKVNGGPLKSITEVIPQRRATAHFTPEPVPQDVLNDILRLGLLAPSGYNLQPWRFIVVEEETNRKKLQAAAFNQPKVAEAPVVIICCGDKQAYRRDIDEIFAEGVRRGAGDPATVEQYKKGALEFLGSHDMNVWVNRHTMISVTHMMLAAEAYGLDTAPMEGFVEAKVKEAFGIPEEVRVVCLLAIGHAQMPDKKFAGRHPIERVVFKENWDSPRTEK
jgi:nitroreductase